MHNHLGERYMFRGKRRDNGKWVYGFLTIDGVGDVNIDVVNSLDIAECYHIVDPATVGQCTGLTAAKSYRGTEPWDLMVFEGDIVNCSRGCPHEIYWCAEYGGTYVGGMPCFYLTGLREGYAWTGSEEIVGTIHDGKTKELDHV